MIELTPEQKYVSDSIIDFALGKLKGDYLPVSGYAGTGKTTVMGYSAACIIKKRPHIRIAYCAPTGKAASVLKKKLVDFNALTEYCTVSTVHSKIYRLIKIEGNEMHWRRKSELDTPVDLFIVDEASMVTRAMFYDIMGYGIPVIFIGDPGQLPPVNDEPFKPLENSRWSLKTVHRQALENPIVRIATDVRNGIAIPYGVQGDSFIKIHKKDCGNIFNMFVKKMLEDDTIVLCGINQTRCRLNQRIRADLGFTEVLPSEGERVICLQNSFDFPVFNGQIFTVDIENGYVDKHKVCYSARIGGYDMICYANSFGTRTGSVIRSNLRRDGYNVAKCMENYDQDKVCIFDYGYVCSVHKAQGSEWNNVCLFDERTSYMSDTEYAQWLYTGVTRAKNKLCIVS